ncbi:MAG: hypothetical protein CL558_13030 [Alphaproteobacteria bacterium]|nr:hypothetical protein [Alphaproteobacteria bacterium]MAX94535.1 hypothetical protein [Alphaproteobacteria bacterium]MAX97084.1 hypothetical protein [Alphaproteobacteria bacterium]MBN54487.1 hypothetical protein [Alphaproteobacteria bacterium]OUT41964.1 MAG: hypothetical protein CBB62_06555 [Micavibrio sp. TMED2]|tara:strand:- start:9178 stop:9360 length:183 start_codon:yes stop_codon:yes gene_type:complete
MTKIPSHRAMRAGAKPAARIELTKGTVERLGKSAAEIKAEKPAKAGGKPAGKAPSPDKGD